MFKRVSSYTCYYMREREEKREERGEAPADPFIVSRQECSIVSIVILSIDVDENKWFERVRKNTSG